MDNKAEQSLVASRTWDWGVFFFLAFLLGCGPSRASFEKKIRSLEKEVSQLRSERVNLEAKAGALDDRVVVLDKKLRRCGEEQSPLLSVVRLSPEVAFGSETPSGRAEPPNEISPSRGTGDEARPVLVLKGMSRRQSHGNVSSLPSGSENFSQYGPENLGVVELNSAEPPPGYEETSDGEMDRFNEAYRAYSNKKYDVALRGFSEFVKENPTHPYADNALFWRGECFLAAGEFFKGIGEFERLLRRYPDSDSAASSLYRIGFSYDRLRDRTKAVEYYFQVVDRFPNTDAARRASQRVSALERRSSRLEKGVVPTTVER